MSTFDAVNLLTHVGNKFNKDRKRNKKSAMLNLLTGGDINPSEALTSDSKRNSFDLFSVLSKSHLFKMLPSPLWRTSEADTGSSSFLVVF